MKKQNNYTPNAGGFQMNIFGLGEISEIWNKNRLLFLILIIVLGNSPLSAQTIQNGALTYGAPFPATNGGINPTYPPFWLPAVTGSIDMLNSAGFTTLCGTGTCVDLQLTASPATASGGSCIGAIGFSSTSGEGFKQTINGLTVGRTYRISFYQNRLSTCSNCSPNYTVNGRWGVKFDNAGSPVYSPTMAHPSNNNSGWQQVSVNLSATAVSHELIFFASVPDNNGVPIIAIDDVSIMIAPENCINGIDDDGDGLVDCDDPDCGVSEVAKGVFAYNVSPAPGSIIFRQALKLKNGNIATIGWASSLVGASGPNQGMIRITDGNLNTIQNIAFNYSSSTSSNNAKMIEMDDGSLVLTGYDNTSPSTVFLIKLKTDYTLDWKKTINVPGIFFVHIVKSQDNHIMALVGGSGTNSTSLLKIDLSGNIVANTRYNLGAFYLYGVPESLTITSNGNLLAMLSAITTSGNRNGIVARFSNDGTTKIWSSVIEDGSITNETFNFAIEGSNGNIYAVGSNGDNFISNTFWKLNGSDGNFIEARSFNFGNGTTGVAIDLDPSGNGLVYATYSGKIGNINFEPAIANNWTWDYTTNKEIGSLLLLDDGILTTINNAANSNGNATLNSFDLSGNLGNCSKTAYTPIGSAGSPNMGTFTGLTPQTPVNVTLSNDLFHSVFTPTITFTLQTPSCGTPLNIELCSNTLDDDGDGLIDSADPDCACAVTSCDKIPNVAYVFGVDEVDPIGNNNRDNADLKLGSCTCDLNPIAYEVQCNNNGTPNNPADDTYTITNFIVTAAAGGGAGGYNLSGGITASGNAYGTAYSYGPFPISGGPLSVTVTDVNTTSCTRTDQIIPPLSCSSCTVMGAANGDAVCAGESIQLTASGGNTYSWQGPNGYTSTDQNPVINGATTAMAGNYSVTVTNTVDGGCTDGETVVVVVTAAPAVSVGADVSKCEEDNITLTATGCSGDILWSTGATTASIDVNPGTDTRYWVQCSEGGCMGTDTVDVFVRGIQITAQPGNCDPATSTHTVTGVILVDSPPAGGTITVSSDGIQQVINAPFTNPINFTLTGLPADGAPHAVFAEYSEIPMCQASAAFNAPASCTTCTISAVTANPGICNPLTNQYSVMGEVTFSDAPTNGQLIVSVSGGPTLEFDAPFPSPLSYSLTGLLADGMSKTVFAYFTEELGCQGSTSFTSPINCTPESMPCTITLDANPGVCDPLTNLYNITGTLTFSNPPASGVLRIYNSEGISRDYNPPFTSGMAYTLYGADSDGGSHSVTALFTADASCNATVPYTAPASCGNNNCNIRLSMEVGVCDPNTNTYEVTGEVYINNPPSGGNIIISYPGGQQSVANTGVSPVSFQIQGLPASGGIGEIGVTMSNDLPCYTNSIYEIPESCGVISLCSISATASASPCDPEHNDYTLTGTLTFSNAPTGNIILEIDGITHTITGPVSSPLMYEIPGMPSDGSDHQLLVYFENNANCSNSVTYTAPAVCAPNTCTMSMNLVTGTCQSATNTFSVSGSLTVSNAPASGQLRIWIEGTGIETVINAPFGANIPFSFNNMVSTGLPYDIKASFSADLSCQVRRSFVAPDACLSGGGCEVQVLAAAACTSGATFTVTGMVLIQNAPSSGTMTIRVGTLLQTLSAPFDPMAFIGFSGFPLGTDVPVEITFSADAGCSVTTTVAAPQDCNCEVSLGTVSGLCVEGTETHNARGTVTLVNPPLTGMLTISVPGGQSEVFTAPFNSPLYYEVTGLPDGGGSRTVTAAFSADAGCTATQSYTAPVDCPICDIQLPVVQSLSCYNNDTPSKITDNKIRIRLLVTNANPALTTYNLTVNGGTTISPAVGLYGVGTEFTMGPGTAGGGATFIITITDSSGLTCNTAEVTVPDPGNCNNTTECPTIKCGSVIIQVNGN